MVLGLHHHQHKSTYSLHQSFQRGILQHEGIKHLLCFLAHIQQHCVVRKEGEGVKAKLERMLTGVDTNTNPESVINGLFATAAFCGSFVGGFGDLWLYCIVSLSKQRSRGTCIHVFGPLVTLQGMWTKHSHCQTVIQGSEKSPPRMHMDHTILLWLWRGRVVVILYTGHICTLYIVVWSRRG